MNHQERQEFVEHMQVDPESAAIAQSTASSFGAMFAPMNRAIEHAEQRMPRPAIGTAPPDRPIEVTECDQGHFYPRFVGRVDPGCPHCLKTKLKDTEANWRECLEAGACQLLERLESLMDSDGTPIEGRYMSEEQARKAFPQAVEAALASAEFENAFESGVEAVAKNELEEEIGPAGCPARRRYSADCRARADATRGRGWTP
ncbi:MAG: hypothetical protein L0H37_01145 [Nitrosospira sp.]|nr:hypothetical protein [Nitrosospira sp.]